MSAAEHTRTPGAPLRAAAGPPDDGVPASLSSMTWPEVAAGPPLVAVPLGSTEQHGPHLPTGTDTLVAVALTRRLAQCDPRVVVAPPLSFGASGEHAGFPGTLSIGHDALVAVLVELVRSADAFEGVVFVNGHGGNVEALARAQAVLTSEGRRVLVWSPTLDDAGLRAGVDAHAGRTETSLMLALEPALVRVDRAEKGDTRPLRELMAELRARGVAGVSPNGVLGDPTGATVAEGQALLESMALALVAAVAAWAP